MTYIKVFLDQKQLLVQKITLWLAGSAFRAEKTALRIEIMSFLSVIYLFYHKNIFLHDKNRFLHHKNLTYGSKNAFYEIKHCHFLSRMQYFIINFTYAVIYRPQNPLFLLLLIKKHITIHKGVRHGKEKQRPR